MIANSALYKTAGKLVVIISVKNTNVRFLIELAPVLLTVFAVVEITLRLVYDHVGNSLACCAELLPWFIFALCSRYVVADDLGKNLRWIKLVVITDI